MYSIHRGATFTAQSVAIIRRPWYSITVAWLSWPPSAEIINMSDRVLVMCNGYSTGILNRDELTQERIMTLATTEIGA